MQAGTFKAFRIAWEQERPAAYSPWGVPAQGKLVLWWSPDVRAFIKKEAHSREMGRDWELVFFKPGQAASTQ